MSGSSGGRYFLSADLGFSREFAEEVFPERENAWVELLKNRMPGRIRW